MKHRVKIEKWDETQEEFVEVVSFDVDNYGIGLELSRIIAQVEGYAVTVGETFMRSIDDWPYSGRGGLDDNYRNGVDKWVETNAYAYEDQWEVLPPGRIGGGAFSLMPALTGNIHAVFVQIGDRYFAKYCNMNKWDPNRYRVEIAEQFGLSIQQNSVEDQG